MNANPCHREDELLEALGRGYVGPELEEHIAACRSCAEIQLVAGAFLEERVDAITEAHVPSSGTMLWRMQMRQRQEAQATTRRSLLLGQALTLLVATFIMVSVLGAVFAVEVREVVATIRLSTPLLFAAATWILALPIAGWVAIRQK